MRDELISLGLPLVEPAARRLGLRPGDLAWDEAISAGQEALITAAAEYDPGRCPFEAFAAQRLRWAMLGELRKRRVAVSLDAEIGEDGFTLGATVQDKLADDPAELAANNEMEERKMRGTLKLAECRTLTPRVEGVGAWALKLREAAFNAVSEGDISELMASLLKQAKSGDVNAARLVLQYLTGGGAPRVQQVVIVNQDGQPAKAQIAEGA